MVAWRCSTTAAEKAAVGGSKVAACDKLMGNRKPTRESRIKSIARGIHALAKADPIALTDKNELLSFAPKLFHNDPDGRS